MSLLVAGCFGVLRCVPSPQSSDQEAPSMDVVAKVPSVSVDVSEDAPATQGVDAPGFDAESAPSELNSTTYHQSKGCSKA